MRAKFSLCILFATVIALSMTVPAFSSFAIAEPVMKTDGVSATSSSPKITIDGKLEDWNAIPKDSLYNFTDAIGDTYQWSKNATILGLGATAEKPGDVAKNDMCRDLKALYFYSDIDYIYMRLDVAGLYTGWNNTSTHPGGRLYDNVSQYTVFIDTDPGGSKGHWEIPGADEANFTNGNWPNIYIMIGADGAPWETRVHSLEAAHRWYEILDSGGTFGGMQIATNISRGAFELSIDRKKLEAEFGPMGEVHVWAFSHKPGEDWSNRWGGNWIRKFDPQAPATPGEDFGAPDWPGTGPPPGGKPFNGTTYWWQDWGPWLYGHNITTSPAVEGLNGINNVTGNPYTLTYPKYVDFADVLGNNDPGYAFTYPTAQWNHTKAWISDNVRYTVNLRPPAFSPKAAFTYKPRAPYPDQIITFNATASTSGFNGSLSPSERPITSYEWNFGDGNTGAGMVTTHKYTARSLYNVTLKVTCQPGVTPNTDTTWKLVTVSNILPANITVDGKLSDWAAAGIQPVYNDSIGDTEPWSKNTTAGAPLYYGNTSETQTQIPINDKARDLKAFYFTFNATHIFGGIQVNDLPTGDFGYGSGKLNASSYVVTFDTDFIDGSGQSDLGSATDTNVQKSVYWERRLIIENMTFAQLQNQTWAWVNISMPHGGNIALAVNTTTNFIEFAIPREDFPAEWDATALGITVCSFKPGESWGSIWGGPVVGYNWTHAFDPQAPGTPGEVSGNPGLSATGSDLADVMPGSSGILVQAGLVKEYLMVPTGFALISHPREITVYEVQLNVSMIFTQGTNLTIEFFSYDGKFQAKLSVWNRTTSNYVELSIQVQHPLKVCVSIATLVLTDKDGKVISNVTTFIMSRPNLFSRITKIVQRWPYAPSAERITLFKEIVDISKQWPYAPSK